jgi:lipopolysaccharide/colanic/teichoic acid biosynthesis glycosyltransferase
MRLRKKRAKKSVEFDEYYLKNRSFALDFKILWITFVKVVKREDAH